LYEAVKLVINNKFDISQKMYKKCPSLFRKNGFDKLCGWLYNYTNEINIIEISDKKYFWFKPQYKE